MGFGQKTVAHFSLLSGGDMLPSVDSGQTLKGSCHMPPNRTCFTMFPPARNTLHSCKTQRIHTCDKNDIIRRQTVLSSTSCTCPSNALRIKPTALSGSIVTFSLISSSEVSCGLFVNPQSDESQQLLGLTLPLQQMASLTAPS